MSKANSYLSKLKSLIIAVLLLGVLTGCVNTPNNAIATQTVTFTDALGRTVSVQKKPSKVAALIGSFADVWRLAGGTVCASADDAWDDFGLDLKEAVNIGGAHSPSLELLFSSNPDFVIASASTASNVKLKETLENAGVTVAYFDVDCFDDYLNMLNICTDITERKDLYEKNGLALKKRIESIKQQHLNSQIPQAQRTVLLLRVSSGLIKAKGSKGTILGEMLNDLGCINIADSDNSLLENLSIESVIKQQPYHIFVVYMGNDVQAAQKNFTKMLEENPAWGTLEAIKQKRLHFMDRKLFNLKPNSRWGESYEQLSQTLQSDK